MDIRFRSLINLTKGEAIDRYLIVIYILRITIYIKYMYIVQQSASMCFNQFRYDDGNEIDLSRVGVLLSLLHPLVEYSLNWMSANSIFRMIWISSLGTWAVSFRSSFGFLSCWVWAKSYSLLLGSSFSDFLALDWILAWDSPRLLDKNHQTKKEGERLAMLQWEKYLLYCIVPVHGYWTDLFTYMKGLALQ